MMNSQGNKYTSMLLFHVVTFTFFDIVLAVYKLSPISAFCLTPDFLFFVCVLRWDKVGFRETSSDGGSNLLRPCNACHNTKPFAYIKFHVHKNLHSQYY